MSGPSPLDLRDALARRVVLLDGGLGSMLIAAGLGPGEVPEAWTLSRPDDLAAIHTAYLEAGAEVVQANTFGANRLKLDSAPGGLDLDVARVNEEAVRIGREAALEFGDPARLVSGDMGPTGRFFPPVGDLDAEEAHQAFAEQARILDAAGVDAFFIETMVDLREAVTALRAVREVSALPVLVELTFDRKPRGFFTLMGDTPLRAAEALLAEGADAVGANCTLASDEMIDLAREFRDATDAPLVIQPNAGRPTFRDGAAVYEQSPEDFARDVWGIVKAGASVVGGCCGTDPAFIRAVRNRLTGEEGEAD